MVLLAFFGIFLVFGAAVLYWLLGTSRYGGNRSTVTLQLTATQAALAHGAVKPEPCRTIRVYFIKPSRYDEEGYVQYFRYGVQPNNTLTVLTALNEAFNKRCAGERNVRLETVIWDEICDGIVSPQTITAIKEKAREDGVELLMGLAGVQSNQYPRGRDLALQFVAEGLPTMMGGFHVSGFPDSCKFLNECGVTTVVGEAENIWGAIVEDFLRGDLQKHYTVTEGIRAKTGQDDIIVPLITDSLLPVLDDRYLTRFFNESMTTLDTSRGCPFTCSYCSVKNVMGRTMRSREPDSVVSWVRDACRNHGIESLFLVDDDFFRSPRWEEILTGLIDVKKEYPKLSFMMQVDVDASCYANVAEGEAETAKHRRSRKFTELAAAAGCYQAFVGIESLNPDNLNFATKYQNTDDRQHKWKIEAARAHVIDKYKRVVENWHKVGVSVHAGYMLGFPFDGPDCGRVAAATLKKIGFDIVSFFIMTPLPGTEDQVRFTKEGSIIDWDFNQLDSQHVTLKHEKLDTESWLGAYRDAFLGFYSIPRLLHTIFTVCAGRNLDAESRRAVLRQFTYYFFSYRQGRHPMVGGIWPIRRRDVRRATVTDDEARRFYLGKRFDAILRGDGEEGFAAAPA
ncbi:MAG: radical SAM protein [Candidatus Binatus sp.]|uniref:B12-binding domain-containing radical SAM protein n=1 Tax=Candidatus Binatus sp. TaxID=2811406 RepID=UPI002715C49B|nr:radical SAM protein [Candidatus Binatus sp.]MDO8433047.1 radical SAM protein [Candidatus Binatus sp.]